MIKITTQQAQARFKSLPEKLQDALFSLQVAETTGRVAEQNHIPEEKISKVADVAGLVFLGFIHPEEAASEIHERIGIDIKAARSIADSLQVRIFEPLKKELDSAYAPLPEEEPETVLSPTEKPSRIVEQVQEIKEKGSELVDVLRKRSPDQTDFSMGIKRPVDALKTTSAEMPPKPLSPMSIDYKKPGAPVAPPEKFDFSKITPGADSLKEVSSLGDDNGPMMIHKESKIVPGAPMRAFHLEMPEDKMRESGSGMEGERQPAKLDIGGMSKIPEGPARTEVIAPRVVHYGPGQEFEKPPRSQMPPPPPPTPRPTANNFNSKPSTNYSAKDLLNESSRASEGRLPITDSKIEKPGWLSKILHRSAPKQEALRPPLPPSLPPQANTKQVNYSATPTVSQEKSPVSLSANPAFPPSPSSLPLKQPEQAKKVDAINKIPESFASQTQRGNGFPPPNLPVSPKIGEEVIDLNLLRKLQK